MGARAEPVDVTRDQLVAVLATFTGVLAQTPPMYSALKRDGKPLYAYARAGLTVERAPRSITIHGITLLDFADDRFTINVGCTKGTYIRVLAEDIGAALGCGATLAGLRRTQVGSFGLAAAVSLAELEQLPEAQRADSLLPSIAWLTVCRRWSWNRRRGADCAGQGAQINVRAISAVWCGCTVRTALLGLGELDTDGRLVPKRLVATSRSASSAGPAASTTS